MIRLTETHLNTRCEHGLNVNNFCFPSGPAHDWMTCWNVTVFIGPVSHCSQSYTEYLIVNTKALCESGYSRHVRNGARHTWTQQQWWVERRNFRSVSLFCLLQPSRPVRLKCRVIFTASVQTLHYKKPESGQRKHGKYKYIWKTKGDLIETLMT